MNLDRRTLLVASAGLGLSGLGAVAARAAEADLFPIVETTNGKIRGIQAGGVRMFKGVHYGASTAGKNRFMPPRPVAKWPGVRDALDYGNYAPQNPTSRVAEYTGLIHFDIQPGGMGEDCLQLNIWTPAGATRGSKRPVMFHIHGGGYYGGSGNSPGFDGEALARFGNAVVITVTHRLGAFGYLNLMEEGPSYAQSGVVGMMDLVAALQWVKANAEAFGGDPNKVLAYGQSGGGSKTSVLLAMPSAKGLFQRAGVMSGSATTVATREAQAEAAHNLMKALGVAKGQAAKLQAMPFTTILSAQSDLESGQRSKGEAPRSFSPCLDGVVIPRHPFDPDAPAISADIPMMITSALDERAYRLTNFNLDDAGLKAFAAGKVGAANADALVAMYKADDAAASPYLLQCRMDTDQTFRRGYYQQADRKVAQGAAKAWLGLWKAPSPAYGGRYGALHGIDVGPSLHDVRGGLNGPTAENVKLADQLASAWVSFAETGDPNNAKTPAWAPYNASNRPVMTWEKSGGVIQNDPRGKFRQFWADKPAGGGNLI
jgi:para-nitrobenzyl esterase